MHNNGEQIKMRQGEGAMCIADLSKCRSNAPMGLKSDMAECLPCELSGSIESAVERMLWC